MLIDLDAKPQISHKSIPVLNPYVPALQSRQSSAPLYFPVWHILQFEMASLFAPLEGLFEPEGQSLHALTSRAGSSLYLPAVQSSQEVRPFAYLPTAQYEQALPPLDILPAEHVLHDDVVHFPAAQSDPASQLEHCCDFLVAYV